MASPPILDLPALTAPIAGDSPAGVPVSYETREQLDEFRKEVDPAAFGEDDPMRPDQPRRADWEGIVGLATATLTGTSKDLL